MIHSMQAMHSNIINFAIPNLIGGNAVQHLAWQDLGRLVMAVKPCLLSCEHYKYDEIQTSPYPTNKLIYKSAMWSRYQKLDSSDTKFLGSTTQCPQV